jgi:hypothetical protein
MPDYRTYKLNDKGEKVEIPPEEFAKFLGISEYDANLLLHGMNITKSICVIAGQLENPPLIWNQNMPGSLVRFVSEHVIEKLKSNPSYSRRDFDWKLLYEEDGETLKYRD